MVFEGEPARISCYINLQGNLESANFFVMQYDVTEWHDAIW